MHRDVGTVILQIAIESCFKLGLVEAEGRVKGIRVQDRIVELDNFGPLFYQRTEGLGHDLVDFLVFWSGTEQVRNHTEAYTFQAIFEVCSVGLRYVADTQGSTRVIRIISSKSVEHACCIGYIASYRPNRIL